MVKIIGLHGKAGVGKSTVATAFRETDSAPICRVLSFATPVKAMLNSLYMSAGVTLPISEDSQREFKKTRLPGPFAGKTPRFLMQTLGTEWGRNTVNGDLWADLGEIALDRALADYGENLSKELLIIFDDVRFQSEVDMIERRGGEVFVLWREGVESIPGNHASEAGLNFPHERVVENTTPVKTAEKILLRLAQF